MITGNNIAVDSIPLDRLAGGGITSGRPVRGRIGKTFWVDSTAAQFGDGKADFPCRSIVTALALCESGRGDVILVAAGHSEPVITAAGGITISKNNVAIVGLGEGTNRPTLTYSTSVNASLLVSGQGVRIEGLCINGTGIDALVSPLNISGASCVVQNCTFVTASTTNQCVQAILTTSGANGLIVRGNTFRPNSSSAATTAGVDAAITIVGGANARIEDNIIIGAFGSAIGGIQVITTAASNLAITGNLIRNHTASNTKAITILTASTGIIARNMMQILSGTAPITGDAMMWVGGNYYAAAVATAGTLI